MWRYVKDLWRCINFGFSKYASLCVVQYIHVAVQTTRWFIFSMKSLWANIYHSANSMNEKIKGASSVFGQNKLAPLCDILSFFLLLLAVPTDVFTHDEENKWHRQNISWWGSSFTLFIYFLTEYVFILSCFCATSHFSRVNYSFFVVDN